MSSKPTKSGDVDQAVFTTGEVARLCNVTIRTVIRWIDRGQLKGYRIPGSRDRRVPRNNLVSFMKEHDLPLGDLVDSSGPKRVLIVDDEASIVSMLQTFFDDHDEYETEVAMNGYEAGARTMEFKPDLLLIDYNLGDVTGLDVARTLRSNEQLSGTRILCMSGYLDDGEIDRVLREGVDLFMRKPLDLEELKQNVDKLLFGE